MQKLPFWFHFTIIAKVNFNFKNYQKKIFFGILTSSLVHKKKIYKFCWVISKVHTFFFQDSHRRQCSHRLVVLWHCTLPWNSSDTKMDLAPLCTTDFFLILYWYHANTKNIMTKVLFLTNLHRTSKHIHVIMDIIKIRCELWLWFFLLFLIEFYWWLP